ncbi:ROK family protein [Nanoarchaeota archaeon]
MAYFIGIDVGATKIEGVLINQNHKILTHQKIPTPKNKKQFLTQLQILIQQLKTKPISGIGIGVPGQVKNGLIVKLRNITGIKNLNLKKIIQNKFKVKTIIENDANCFALAQARSQKKTNLIGLTLGSGVGGGIIINNQIHRGQDGLAGEFGQISYQNKTFEDYCSGKFFKNKTLNQKTFNEFGRHLGNLINTVINSLNPEIIVLGGSVSNDFNLFKKSMTTTLKKSLIYPQLKKTKIIQSKLKHAGALGAASLFLHNL